MTNITIAKPSNIDALRFTMNEVRKISEPIMIIVSDAMFTSIGFNELDGIPIKSVSHLLAQGISVPEMKTDDHFLIITDKTFGT